MKRAMPLILIAVALCPAAAVAQRGRGGGRGRGGSGQTMDEPTVVLLFTTLLNLSDSQHDQLQAILADAVKVAAPISAKLDAGRDALYQAAQAGKSDDEMQKIATQQGSLRTQILAMHAQTFAKFLKILTSDQKAKVTDEMFDEFGGVLSGSGRPAPPPLPNHESPIDQYEPGPGFSIGHHWSDNTSGCGRFDTSPQAINARPQR